MVKVDPEEFGVNCIEDDIVIVDPNSATRGIMDIGHSKESMTFIPGMDSDAKLS